MEPLVASLSSRSKDLFFLKGSQRVFKDLFGESFWIKKVGFSLLGSRRVVFVGMIIASTSSKAIAAEVAKAPLKPSFWAIKEVVNSTIDGHHVDNDVL